MHIDHLHTIYVMPLCKWPCCITAAMRCMTSNASILRCAGQSSHGLIPVEDAHWHGVESAEMALADPQSSTKLGVTITEEDLAQEARLSKIKLPGMGSKLLQGDDPESPIAGQDEVGEAADKDDDLALEEALQKEMFDKVMEEQRLSKGQRINIGSPDTYFRPVYATAAGVKSAPEQQDRPVQGRLQVISTSVLSDPSLMEQMNRQFHQGQARPGAIDAATAAEAVAAATAAVAEGSVAAVERAAAGPAPEAVADAPAASTCSVGEDQRTTPVPFQGQVVGPNPFQGVPDVSSTPTMGRFAGPGSGQIASTPGEWNLSEKGPAPSAKTHRLARMTSAALDQVHSAPTAEEKGKAKLSDSNPLYSNQWLGAFALDEAGPSDLRSSLYAAYSAMPFSSNQAELPSKQGAVPPADAQGSPLWTEGSRGGQEVSSPEEDVTGLTASF